MMPRADSCTQRDTKMRKSLFIIIPGCLVLAVAIVFGFRIWQFERPPLPLARLQQLHTGMTTNEVRQVLGTPASSWMRTNEAGRCMPNGHIRDVAVGRSFMSILSQTEDLKGMSMIVNLY